MTTKRGALVIGVDNPGEFTPLKSAASSAEDVGNWLESEGYDVECVTDKGNPVTINRVKRSLQRFITDPATYDFLVIYFSGHGLLNYQADIWLLSEAIDNNEAVNLLSTIDQAKYADIPNVVFISDACRTIPSTPEQFRTTGNDIIGRTINTRSRGTKIDIFNATSDFAPAFEVTINGETKSVFTHAFYSAYVEATPDMILDLPKINPNISVVPNRKLEVFLQNKVDAILSGIDPTLEQDVNVSVPSQDEIYISRYLGHISNITFYDLIQRDQDIFTADFEDMPHRSRDMALHQPTKIDEFKPYEIVSMLGRSRIKDFDKFRSRIVDQATVDHFETECGFVIYGTKAKSVITRNESSIAEIIDLGAESDAIRIGTPFSDSVVIEFESGKGAVLPSLKGYIGTIIVDENGISQVSYSPSSNNQRYEHFKKKATLLEYLRSAISVNIERGRFVLDSELSANKLAKTIRMEKAIDPTLGLYAAHAYSQAGNDREIQNILEVMYDDLNTELFDIAVLASRFRDNTDTSHALPFCPLLTQTWHYLANRNIQIPEFVREASQYLSNSLWTTFSPEGLQLIQAETRKKG